MIERLKILENNVKELQILKTRFNIADILSDKSKEWALRYGLLETIQIVIDVSCHLVAKYNLGNPASYSECIDLLKRYEYIDEHLYGGAFKMITRRQGGSDAGILFCMSRKLTTKPTQFAFECDFVLADKLFGMIGLRNILVHEYIFVEAEKLYNLLDNVQDFKEFADKVREFI